MQKQPRLKVKRILCRRINAKVTPETHKNCPYCYGKLEDICTALHDQFCDYKKDKDPISFKIGRAHV